MDKSSKDEENKIVEKWLSGSEDDLKAANLLYDNKLFALCLYHLQQSNEKLAKALLLSLPLSTPKRRPKDYAVQSALGFLPRTPSSYGHRIMPHFLSDIEKSVPSIQEYLKLLRDSEFGKRITEFSKTVKTSGENVQKLRKNPPVIIRTTENLEKEITSAQSLLDKVDPIANKINEELNHLDYTQIVRIATGVSRKRGFKVDASRLPSFEEMKTKTGLAFRLSMLTTLSVGLSALLDPLVSVTRYPDSKPISVDENDPYVKNFYQFHDVIARILKMSQQLHKNET